MTSNGPRHPHLDRAQAWLAANRTVRLRDAPVTVADQVLQVRAAVILDRQLAWNAHRRAHRAIAARAGGGVRGEQVAKDALGGGFRTASANQTGYVVR